MTDAEKKLWRHLRQAPFDKYHFRRQATIGPYFADFASHDLRLIIEVDGGQHADSEADVNRTADLKARGYHVLRFWNNDVIGNIAGVLSSIDDFITAVRATPHPRPLPAASGGRGVGDAS